MAVDWDLTADGQVALCPLTGWQITLMAEIAVGVQVEFVRSDEQLMRGERERLQLVMTPAQAAEFGEALQRKLGEALQRPSESEN